MEPSNLTNEHAKRTYQPPVAMRVAGCERALLAAASMAVNDNPDDPVIDDPEEIEAKVWLWQTSSLSLWDD